MRRAPGPASPSAASISSRPDPSEILLRSREQALGFLFGQHVEQRVLGRLRRRVQNFGQQPVVELLVEDEARVTARIFYLDREILTFRQLDRALEMRPRFLG